MTVWFTRLYFGWPNDYRPPQDTENSWRIYTVCERNARRSCTTRRDVRNMAAVADQRNAQKSFVSFSLKAQTGLDLRAMFDEDQCHEAHEFKHPEPHGPVQKVWRLWPAGKIRIYFIYLPGKRIVILKSQSKRTDRLSDGEKQELAELGKAVLNTIDQFGFEPQEV